MKVCKWNVFNLNTIKWILCAISWLPSPKINMASCSIARHARWPNFISTIFIRNLPKESSGPLKDTFLKLTSISGNLVPTGLPWRGKLRYLPCSTILFLFFVNRSFNLWRILFLRTLQALIGPLQSRKSIIPKFRINTDYSFHNLVIKNAIIRKGKEPSNGKVRLELVYQLLHTSQPYNYRSPVYHQKNLDI